MQHIRYSHAPRKVALERNELLALSASITLKSSHRFAACHDDGMSRAEYDEARTTLRTIGLLKHNNAATDVARDLFAEWFKGFGICIEPHTVALRLSDAYTPQDRSPECQICGRAYDVGRLVDSVHTCEPCNWFRTYQTSPYFTPPIVPSGPATFVCPHRVDDCYEGNHCNTCDSVWS